MKYTKSFFLIAATLFGYQCEHQELPEQNMFPENATVSGIVYKGDGTTPAVNARVYIRRADALSIPRASTLAKTFSARDSVLTNIDGVFAFTTQLDSGTYLIEATSDTGFALINPIEVTNTDTTIITPPATLQRAGSIKGSVVLSGSNTPQSTFVLAFGIERFARVNNDGSFMLCDLAEGNYSLRIISLAGNYDALDTNGITVISGDTTNLGTIKLYSEEIPVPENLKFTYDTMAVVVSLSWHRCRGAAINGYIIYRRIEYSDQLLSECARTAADDTVMIDSSISSNCRYEYRVATVGANDEVGKKSGSITATTNSRLTVDTIVEVYDGIRNVYIRASKIAVASNGDIYQIDFTHPYVQVFDKNMQLLHRLGEAQLTQPENIKTDTMGNVFVLNAVPEYSVTEPSGHYVFIGQYALHVFDQTGALHHQFTITPRMTRGANRVNVPDFDVKDSLIYVIQNIDTITDDADTIIPKTHSVCVYNYQGELVRTIHLEKRVFSIAKGSSNMLYGGGNPQSITRTINEILVFDTLGNNLSKILIPGGSPNVSSFEMAYAAHNNHLFMATTECDPNPIMYKVVIRVFNLSNNLEATMFWRFPYKTTGAFYVFPHFDITQRGEVIINKFWAGGTDVDPDGTTNIELVRIRPFN